MTIAHADTVGELKREVGYDDTMLERVKNVVGKRGNKVNSESHLLKDIANGVFIAHYLPAFANSTPDYDAGNGWRSSSVPSNLHA